MAERDSKSDPIPDEIPLGKTLMGRFLDEGDTDWGEQGDFTVPAGWEKQKDPWGLDLDDPEHEEVDEEDRGDDSLGASDLEHDEGDDEKEHDLHEPHSEEDDEDDEWD